MEKKLFVFSSPSGGGKSTIIRKLMKEFSFFILSVSATTRNPRPLEIDGVHYHFLNNEQFGDMIKNDEFIEYEQIFDHLYGIPKSEISKIDNNDKQIIFDIDVKGALSLKKLYPDRAILIFIIPPSKEELIRRLTKRNTETQEQINKRIKRAEYELSFQNEFEYVVVNDDLDKAYSEVKRIVLQYIGQEN